MEKCLGSNKARKAGFQDRRGNYPKNGDKMIYRSLARIKCMQQMISLSSYTFIGSKCQCSYYNT